MNCNREKNSFSAGKFWIALCICAVFFASCSARINGQLAGDGSGTVRLEAALEPNMAALIRSLGELGADGSAPQILDAEAFNRSLRAAPGVSSVSLANSGRDRIGGNVAFSRAGDFLAAGDSRFIRYEEKSGSGRLAVRLDRSSAPRLIGLVSPDAADYLSAFMAPAVTGEVLSKQEYLELVGSIYGKAVAGEIASSTLKTTFSVPGPVKSVKGGTFSGREARFDIPLADILVLERPLEYEIVW